MSWTTLSIIGSAGRKEDAAKVSKERFDAMVYDANQTIIETLKLDPKKLILVSGGAAFGDHVAVKLFLDYGYSRLRLFLPCQWQLTTSATSLMETSPTNIFVKSTMKRKYVDEVKVVSDTSSPSALVTSTVPAPISLTKLPLPGFIGNAEAKRAQELHEAFGKKLGYNTLIELEAARLKGAEFISRTSFAQRNQDIANSTHLLAYTFAGGSIPKTGGSSQTWNMWHTSNRESSSLSKGKCVHRPILSLPTSPTTVVGLSSSSSSSC